MDTKIKKILEKQNVKYEAIEHRKVYTAFNAAETQHVKTNEVIKTVLVTLSNKDLILVAVPAGKRIDVKKVAKAINDQAVKNYKLLLKTDKKAKKPKTVTAKLGTEKDITIKLKTKVGLISPIFELYGLPIMFDKKLLKNKKLLLSAGSYTESIKITTAEYLKKLFVGLQGNFTL